MNKKKLRLILLAIAATLILVIGIGAARIYTQPFSTEVRDAIAHYLYDRDYSELTHSEQAAVDRLLSSQGNREQSIGEKNAKFRQWLLAGVKWVMIALSAFIILTAALVASRLISNRLKPPPNPM